MCISIQKDNIAQVFVCLPWKGVGGMNTCAARKYFATDSTSQVPKMKY